MALTHVFDSRELLDSRHFIARPPPSGTALHSLRKSARQAFRTRKISWRGERVAVPAGGGFTGAEEGAVPVDWSPEVALLLVSAGGVAADPAEFTAD